MPNVLLDFLNTGVEALTFDELYQKFQSFFAEYYAQQLKGYQNQWNNLRNSCASPFESICLTGCIESGLAVEEGGGQFNLSGLNILGLGTLVDSLLALKSLVYGKQKLSLHEMRKQLKESDKSEEKKVDLLVKYKTAPSEVKRKVMTGNAELEDIEGEINEHILKEHNKGDYSDIKFIPNFEEQLRKFYLDAGQMEGGIHSLNRLFKDKGFMAKFNRIDVSVKKEFENMMKGVSVKVDYCSGQMHQLLEIVKIKQVEVMKK